MTKLLEAYSAIKSQNLDALKNILDSGFDINVSGGESTLLSAAVNTGNIEIVKLLIDAGADVNIRDEYGATALFFTNYETTKLLIDAGADVNIRDEYGATALFFTNYEKTKLLIDAGADVNIQDSEGRTALFADDIEIEILKLLIDAGADVNIQDSEGYTVLFHANYNIKKLLVEYGADVNIKAEDESTALFSAKNIADVKFLIDSGADVNIQDMHGETALFHADNNDIFNLLVSSGADVNIQDNEGKTLLFYRADNYRIALLLGSGADVNIQDKSGRTALYYFSKKGDFENVKLLLSKGASINFPIDQISDPKIKKYLINRKTLWKSTVREKLMTKMESTYNYRSEKVCDVFNVLNKEELVMVANLYNIDEKLSRFQICQKLKDILDGKIKGKEEALGTCNNVETGILQTDIKDIDPRSFFTFEQNGKIYCEEVEALYEQIFVHGITKNAFTNQPFSEAIKNRIEKHYQIYIKDRILEEEKPQESLSALYAKLHGFLYYPVTNTKFEDSGREDLKEFVSSLPIWARTVPPFRYKTL
jgi:ankyrin repeat protein